MSWRSPMLCTLALLSGCLLPASERVALDRTVGQAESAGWTVVVRDGLASVRTAGPDRIELWAQAPQLELALTHAGAAAPLVLDVLNCVAGSQLSFSGGVLPAVAVDGRPASCRFALPAVTAESLTLAPADAAVDEPFAFAVLSDVQEAVGRVQGVFARMNQDPALRFVVSTGDLVETGARGELVRFQRELGQLRIPFYSTVGNHEMGAAPSGWHELFGPFNVHFRFKGVAFSLVDSGNATIDPDVYERLDGWLDAARGDVHVVLTHYPPLDPVGLRGGGFRSRKEGAKLLQRLGDGRADALFLGHIHSYYAFSVAGVPTYISGGGGAIQERLDGIERHYLKLEVQPRVGVASVAIVRIE